MTTRHHDSFNGTGALSSVSYWQTSSASTWTLGGGVCSLDSPINVDSQAVHQTDGNLGGGLPSTFSVGCGAMWEVGAKFIGLRVLSGSNPNVVSSQVRFRWLDNFGEKFQLQVIGFADLTVTAPTGLVVQDGVTRNDLLLTCAYQGLDASTSKPIYRFIGLCNGATVLTSGPYVLSYWDSTEYHIGMIGRRENFGPNNPPSVKFNYIFSGDTITANHEPKPTKAATVTRTPITVADETPVASPDTFPFSLGIVGVRNRMHTRRLLTDLGYEVSHPIFANGRRTFQCTWSGSEADKDTLVTFFEDHQGATNNFQVTIRAHSIGTVDVAFLSTSLDVIQLGQDVFRVNFELVEVF